MKTINAPQGSPEWHAHRATARNASEAPAMLGCSPHMTRGELLQAMHTGMRPEPTPAQQDRFNDGHAIEAAQRPGAEEFIGDDLAPVVGCEVIDGIELSASFDGLTLMGDTAYECKTLNEELRTALSGEFDPDTAGDLLPKHYRVQMEQQLMVSGAKRVLFVAATLAGDDVRRCWYYPNPKLRAEILAGWKQFDADLAIYTPRAAEPPKPTGQAPELLPALRIELRGEVTASNLGEFRETALGAIRSVNRELSTDQHFADAEKAVKWCGDVEDRLAAAKQHALSQTASIDALFRTIDEISAEARRVRLDLDKLVKARKEAIRGEIAAEGVTDLRAHVAALNGRFPRPMMPGVPCDFGAAMKGKKTIASLRDAMHVELTNAKLAANAIADKIDANLRHFAAQPASWEGYFADLDRLVLKEPEDFAAVVAARIAQAQQKLDAERERIRSEEAARLQREQQEREAAERREREESEARAARESVAPAAAPAAPAVVPLQRAAAPASPPTLKLGSINARLAPLSIDAAGLARLGFPHAATDKSAKLYHECDFPRMVDTMVAHLRTAAQQKEAA
jgi:predicted phage-related endonuclease